VSRPRGADKKYDSVLRLRSSQAVLGTCERLRDRLLIGLLAGTGGSLPFGWRGQGKRSVQCAG